MHNAGFAALGVEAEYSFLATKESEFGSVVDALRSGDLDGVNVTMPHKHIAYRSVDDRSDLAERTGAVNTIVGRDGVLFGTNTDVAGVTHALHQAKVDEITPVLILGAGGAAAAAVVAAGDREVFVSTRSSDAASDMLERTHKVGHVVDWGEGVAGAAVINATPLGMHGEPLPASVLDAASAIVDMTYGSGQSQAISYALDRDLPHADGLDMLIGQALEAFTVFTGLPAPQDVIAQAARSSV